MAVPEAIFDAYIALLCGTRRFDREATGDALGRAARLMKQRQTLSESSWNSLLRARLRRADALELIDPFGYPHMGPIYQMVKTMKKAEIGLEHDSFISFCELFRNRVGRREMRSGKTENLKFTEEPNTSRPETRYLRHLLEQFTGRLSGNDILSSEGFENTIFSGVRNSIADPAADDKSADKETENLVPPTLLATPTAWALHSYVCALGFLHEQRELCQFTSFLVEHATQLTAPLDQQVNGYLTMRFTIIAIRAFLERPWLPNYQIPEELLRFAQERVENMPKAWGGWPSDEECENYLNMMWGRWMSTVVSNERPWETRHPDLGSAWNHDRNEPDDAFSNLDRNEPDDVFSNLDRNEPDDASSIHERNEFDDAFSFASGILKPGNFEDRMGTKLGTPLADKI
ncbi:hypothetical protein K490DRAFT_66816 [Saccharata proteae CBS 121410]|uniref:Uncharacterized protein n=1 Tax=Saccharata proteae CBS 121410 TaxID=1314787 RepID=A0A9P4HUI7_9PEZI|nr:hypothetical protein K490DRAFT_66816 [Saccharata proteae CBS 121410]